MPNEARRVRCVMEYRYAKLVLKEHLSSWASQQIQGLGSPSQGMWLRKLGLY